MVNQTKVAIRDSRTTKTPEPRLSPEEKWEELKRHLLENLTFYRKQQNDPKADSFYFFLKSGTTADTVAYMMYLDGIRNKDNALLWSMFGDPTKGEFNKGE